VTRERKASIQQPPTVRYNFSAYISYMFYVDASGKESVHFLISALGAVLDVRFKKYEVSRLLEPADGNSHRVFFVWYVLFVKEMEKLLVPNAKAQARYRRNATNAKEQAN